MGCFSGRLMSAASDQKLFCKLCSPFCCSFSEFVEEKVITPSYSSAILTPPPHSFFNSFKFKYFSDTDPPVQLAVFVTGMYYNLYFINAETEKSELFA